MPSFNEKKSWRRWIFYHNLYQLYPLFSSFFYNNHYPKYFNFAANKLSPIGMNLFLLLSRHIKHSNFEGIQMLYKQQGQNMNLYIGCRVFYGVDSNVDLAKKMAFIITSISFKNSWPKKMAAIMEALGGLTNY